MLLRPTWVCVYYRTASGKNKEKMLHSTRSNELKIIHRIRETETVSIYDCIKKILPRGASFDFDEGDLIRISYRYHMFEYCGSEPFIIVELNKLGLSITEHGIANNVHYHHYIAPQLCCMRDVRRVLATVVVSRSCCTEFVQFIRKHRVRTGP